MKPWTVPQVGQTTISTCWEAAAHMMWDWKYQEPAQRALYYPYLGNFRNVKNGLSPGQMDRCYKGLGLRSLANPQGKNVLWALQWTPVIIMDVDKAFGHAMVVAGSRGQDYVIADPCAVEDLDFDKPGNDRCTFGMRKASRASADATLGSYIWYW